MSALSNVFQGRPGLRTDYARDQRPLQSTTQRVWLTLGIVAVFLAPIVLTSELEARFTTVFVYGIGAIGLNLVTGYAGQVSLGHAFFLGVGAYTAAALGGSAGTRTMGFELDMLIWLPAAGLVAGLLGLVVAPVATRLKGLYLAIVTLGLVFVGEHLFRSWVSLTGGPGTGRAAPRPVIGGFDLSARGDVLGIPMTREIRLYLFSLIVLIVLSVVAKNLTRSKVGRAFAAVRDRDIAAEIMGVELTKHKVIAFAVSSFYAGVCGALLAVSIGFVEPTFFNLFLSINFLAMILIGGVATLSGSLIGAVFVGLAPRFVEEFAPEVPGLGSYFTVFEIQTILFGVLIVVFLIVEPRGVYGLWVRIKNYFKAWPFSY